MAEPRPSYRIRPMRLEDVEQVAEIEKQSFALPWPPETYRRDLRSDSLAHYYVCEAESSRARVVGYIGYWLIEDEAHISTIAVHPRWRGLGLGEYLLSVALDDACERGAHSASLEVRVSNAAAQGLYIKYDFRVSGRRRRYYRDNNEDAFIMQVASLTSAEYRVRFERCQEALAARLGNLENVTSRA